MQDLLTEPPTDQFAAVAATEEFGVVPPAAPPTARRRRWPWWAVGAFAAVVVLGGIANAVDPHLMGTTTTAAQVAAVVPPVVPASITTQAPVIPPPVVQPPNLSQMIVAWRDSGGGARLSAITSDFGTIATAAQNGDVPGVKSACTGLRADVESAQAFPGIPDGQAQAAWARGLAKTARGATDCITSTHDNDVALLRRATAELSAGGDQFQAAARRIEAIASQ